MTTFATVAHSKRAKRNNERKKGERNGEVEKTCIWKGQRWGLRRYEADLGGEQKRELRV